MGASLVEWHELAIGGRIITEAQVWLVCGLAVVVALTLFDLWRRSRRQF